MWEEPLRLGCGQCLLSTASPLCSQMPVPSRRPCAQPSAPAPIGCPVSHLCDRHSLNLRPPSLRCCLPRDALASWAMGAQLWCSPGTSLPAIWQEDGPWPFHTQVAPNARMRWLCRPGTPLPRPTLGWGCVVPGERMLPSPHRSVCDLVASFSLRAPHPGGIHTPRPCSLSLW